jgi:quercetin dioxygenase-like cupin family protein
MRAASMLVTSALMAVAAAAAEDPDVGAKAKAVAVEKLADVPGKNMTVVTMTYAPGGKSAKHRHSGSVFTYVLSGAIRSQNSATGPAQIYKAGKSFFEPAGSEHLVSENASETEPATMLVVFIADEKAQLMIFDSKPTPGP